jgi:hypothetical protein
MLLDAAVASRVRLFVLFCFSWMLCPLFLPTNPDRYLPASLLKQHDDRCRTSSLVTPSWPSPSMPGLYTWIILVHAAVSKVQLTRDSCWMYIRVGLLSILFHFSFFTRRACKGRLPRKALVLDPSSVWEPDNALLAVQDLQTPALAGTPVRYSIVARLSLALGTDGVLGAGGCRLPCGRCYLLGISQR